MRYQIQAYLRFLIRSTNQHGVHSPFVFDLVTKCFYDKSEFSEYRILEMYRKSLLRNDDTISVTDFGAGSRVFKSQERRISDITKTAGISPGRAKLLFRLARYFQPKTMLELGTSLGLATSALALGNPSGHIISLEGCEKTASEAAKNLAEFNLKNVRIDTGEFASTLDFPDAQEATFDLIYFDGNHQKEATLRYFERLLPTATNDSVWIFDDIHWSPGMSEAWEIIKKHPKVIVAIDTFQWGFVFFRREQEREHFTIRV
ncbi:O-methyltransferase [Flavobacterium selenitireducens]|uniref:O-methyltransferase n=1 Tax=Flavobacterium selenitireducens TaxID=2722704 RepID=UPI00168BB2DE|nr:class I SAM-dependent methyltransferase [Flavobacterium selenitireducens]MBD3582549.1 class I SAM-dependent methyltransferase [Flavobacterium selenitireducens]